MITLTAKYKAFIISTLTVGLFTLGIININLSSQVVTEEAVYELAFEDADVLEKLLEEIKEEKIEIETHQAFNEAENQEAKTPIESPSTENQQGQKAEDAAKSRSMDERLLDELEKEREMLTSLDGTVIETEASAASPTGSVKNKTIKPKPKLSNADNSNRDIAVVSSANKNTSNYYNLVGRNIVKFPNPIYTCGASGKIVVNITVDTYGKVVATNFNEASSTSKNSCLIENAIDYAQGAFFSGSSSGTEQIGTITYIFPGQGRN